MGFLTESFGKRATKDAVTVKPGDNPPSTWTIAGSLGESGTGVTLTPEMSLQISTVYACVRNLAEDIAKLPLILYKRTSQGKERFPRHPLYSILHDMPNPEMTAFDMRSTLQGHVGSRGNGYAYIDWDGAGKISELWPLRPDMMIPYRDKLTHALMYEYTLESEGVVYHWPKERVLHLHGLGFDGLMGYDPVRMQMRSQGLAWGTEEFGSRFFGNGARPGLVYKHPGQLSDKAYEHLNASMEERHTGLERSHRIRILEEGMTVEKIGIAPDEAQFLETRKFQVSEIARWYRMPPHKVGDLEKATFSNIEEQSLEYITDTLLTWLIRWEQSIAASLLLPRERGTLFAEHLMDIMLRGKTLERYQAYHLALTDGWLNRNEVRVTENRNQVDGLDEYLTQLNMGAQQPAPAARSLSGYERHELKIWHRKVNKAILAGQSADVDFENDYLPDELAASIHARLQNARSVEDTNAIFEQEKE